MKTQISPRDWQLLSEYLDDQLSPGKRARLETRMKSNPGLTTALKELKNTRAAVRSLPHLKAPRSFKLTPEMVGQARPARRIYPVFQFTSALATLLLVLVLVGDFLGTSPQSSAPAPLAEAYPSAEEAADMQNFSVPAEEKIEAVPEAELRVMQASEPVTDTVSAATAVADAAREGPVAPEAGAAAIEALPSPPADTLLDAPTVESEPSPALDLTVWQMAEIALAVIAVTAGLAALYLRRLGS